MSHMFSARHDFSNEWHAFLHPPSDDPHVLSLPLDIDRFPYIYRTGNIEVSKVHLFLQARGDAGEGLPFRLVTPSGTEIPEAGEVETPTFTSAGSEVEGLLYAQPLDDESGTESPGKWTIEIARDEIPGSWRDPETGRLRSTILKDVLVVFEFRVIGL